MPDLQGIAIGTNLDGRLELVVTTNDKFLSPGGPGSVWRLCQWQWRSLDIPIGWGFGGPAIARNKDGRLEIAFTQFGEVLHAWQTAPNGQEWRHASLDQPEEQLPVSVIAQVPPALAANKDGRLEVFLRGDDRAVWHIWQRSQGGWSQWASLEGQPSGWFSELAVGAHADGRLVVFAVADPASGSSREAPRALGEPTALWEREQAVAGGWSPWRSFIPSSPVTLAGPVLALNAHGQLQLRLRLPGRVDLYRLKQNEPNGSEWTQDWFLLDPPPLPRPPTYRPRPAGSREVQRN